MREGHEGEMLLWVIAPVGFRSRIPNLTRLFRWARFEGVTRSALPAWTSMLEGEIYNVCQSCGQYNGYLGQPDDVDPAENRQSAETGTGKLDARSIRARGQAEASRLKKTRATEFVDRVYYDETVRPFLVRLAEMGPVALFFSDGRLLQGAEIDSFLAKWESAHSAPIDPSDPEVRVEWRYWCPLVFAGASYEGASRRNRS